jgi:hypothetical protein
MQLVKVNNFYEDVSATVVAAHHAHTCALEYT